MGEEIKDAVEEMEEVLGLKEESTTDDNQTDNKDTTEQKDGATVSDDTKDTAKDTDETKKDETSAKAQTTTVTSEQLNINKEIAKIDIKIEELEKKEVDINQFYDNLENELTEEEQQLEFNDKAAYMKLVSSKAKEYEAKHSPSSELGALQEQKKELESIYERQSAIVEVSTKYPNYNHETILNFFTNDLSKSEQDKIYANSTSYADVYENTYKKYTEKNPANISTTTAPNIPDVANVRRTDISNNDVDNGLSTDEEHLREALGL